MTGLRIAGVALVLFSGILLGAGIHHLVATGTCSSTGYSANYGPVPTCPSGTGWWFAFVFGGIIGCLVGAAMATNLALVFAGIFGAIGFGSLSIVLDSTASSGTKVFGAIFGGCFAIVGVVAWIAIISGALRSLSFSGSRRPTSGTTSGGEPSSGLEASAAVSAFGTPDASSAFGKSSADADPILSAYRASHSADGATLSPSPTVTSPPRGSAPRAGASVPGAPAHTPLNLIAGIQAARQAAANKSVDELSRLAELHQRGALTDAEFASAKAKLLGEV